MDIPKKLFGIIVNTHREHYDFKKTGHLFCAASCVVTTSISRV